MTDAEKKFLEKNFKAGEYAVVQIMVRLEDLDKFVAHQKKSGLNLCVIPSAKQKMEFEMNTGWKNPTKSGEDV